LGGDENNVGEGMRDAGYKMLDTGYGMLDTGCWIKRCKIKLAHFAFFGLCVK